MANSRIKDLPTKSSLASGDYLAIDNNNGTKKVDASGILSSISSASSSASSAASTASSVSSKINNSSDQFSSSKSYKEGDLVIYGDTLYVCNSDCSAASWSTNRSYFTQTTITSFLNSKYVGFYNESNERYTLKVASKVVRKQTDTAGYLSLGINMAYIINVIPISTTKYTCLLSENIGGTGIAVVKILDANLNALTKTSVSLRVVYFAKPSDSV